MYRGNIYYPNTKYPYSKLINLSKIKLRTERSYCIHIYSSEQILRNQREEVKKETKDFKELTNFSSSAWKNAEFVPPIQNQKYKRPSTGLYSYFVGNAGFEPATPTLSR